MNNIEKLYETAGVEKTYLAFICENKNCEHKKLSGKFACVNCFNSTKKKIKTYPSFTAEKQLELIKWLAKKDYGNYAEKLLISINEGYIYMSVGITTDFGSECLYEEKTFNSKQFEEALAGLINTLWQDLTDDEKQEIKRILND